MAQEALLYHAIIIKIFAALLLLNIVVPLLFQNDSTRAIKAVRISVFFYSALLTMIAFSGLIVYMIGTFAWDLYITLMLLLFILLSVLEYFRIKKLKSLWLAGQSLFWSSLKYILIEFTLLGGMIFLMVVR